ncbi:MAG: glycosyltransferase family 4 protein [Deltaproteobacteria bacterium]|nr:glycosyltransferase family 4 protein [Deltaproteobacteria bacterium]
MNIAILTAGLPPECVGGAEIQASEAATLLSRRHHVTLFTRSRIMGWEHDPARPDVVVCRRTRIDIPILRFPADVFSTLIRLGRYRGRIDIIMAYQTIIDGLIGAVARRLFHIPVIVFVRSEKEYKIHEFRKTKIFAPFVFKNADRIIVQSGRIKDDLLSELRKYGSNGLRKLVETKLGVIPNGVSSRSGTDAESTVVLYVGRLVEGKGVGCLISAMKRCPNERLVIVGDGPEKRRLQRLARNLTNIDFVGRLPPGEVSAYMQKARMLVLPSRSEGFPNVLLEAMAHGVPILATAVGGIPDLIEHGETGFLLESGGAETIAHYIQVLAQDEKLRRIMGQKCLRMAERYSWEKVLPLYEDELRRVLVKVGG